MSGDQEFLFFADDAAMFAARAQEIEEIGAMIFLWVALKGAVKKELVPREPRGVDWIGYWLSVADFRLGISEKRARWIREWVSKTFEKGGAEMREFHAVLGRARLCSKCFGLFALLYGSPLRLCSSSAARGILGTCLCGGRKGQKGQHLCVGGWDCLGGCLPGQARWFSLGLTRDSAPWAFGRGEPFKAIAALELFASLLSLMIFSLGWKKQLRRVGGHQWFHGQCGKRGGAEQTDHIEESLLSSFSRVNLT